MGLLNQLCAGMMVGVGVGITMPRFGGEDPLGSAPCPDNWHHEGLTRQAASAAGWSDQAENALAFHADYVDSYLYNPLWWFDLAHGGGPDRLPVVMSSQSALVKLHFDDLFHPESVRSTWRRYLSGTAAGLVWLGHAASGSLDRRVAMAQNLVGASLHAIQDFSSHSNWIDDPARRDFTWFEVDPDERARMSLWTGSYELPHHHGIKPHGDFLFACTILNNLGTVGRRLMSVICHAASPLAGGSLCRWFKQCKDAVPLHPPDVAGVEPPEGILWVEPGINLDSRWQSELGVTERGLSLNGREAFDAAYELAHRSSCQWLHLLDHVMADAGLEKFWASVKTRGVTRDRYKTPTAPWEDFAQLPYRFLTAGPYPPPQGHDDTDDWYLRLQIRTADAAHAGTDADIVPIVDGRRFPVLDHGVQPSPTPDGDPPSRSLLQTLMGHNDFEAGDEAAYILGPLDGPPRTVTLHNDAPDAGDVILAALEGLWDTLVGLLESIADFFLSLWGYHADFVDQDHDTVSASTLDGLGPGARHGFVLRCDGGSEGNFAIHGFVEGTSNTGAFDNGVPWREYHVQFERLHCAEESDWDRFSNSDEPFVLGLVIPHGGPDPMVAWRTAPYGDVDSGETRTIGRTFQVRVPERYGFISMACAVYESDDESSSDRDDLLDQFSNVVGSGIAEAEDTFIETLSESIASGWRLQSVEAAAFRRGATAEVVAYDTRWFDRWVEGGEQVTWTLRERGRWGVQVPDSSHCGCDEPQVEVDLPPLEVEIPRLDFRPTASDEDRSDRDRIADDTGRVVEIDLTQLARRGERHTAGHRDTERPQRARTSGERPS